MLNATVGINGLSPTYFGVATVVNLQLKIYGFHRNGQLHIPFWRCQECEMAHLSNSFVVDFGSEGYLFYIVILYVVA